MHFLRLRADLRAFQRPFRRLAVVRSVELVDQFWGERVPVGLIAAWLHDPVHNVQAKARVPKAGLAIAQRSRRHTADVAFLANGCLQLRRHNGDLIFVLRDLNVRRLPSRHVGRGPAWPGPSLAPKLEPY